MSFLSQTDSGNPKSSLFGFPLTAATKKVLFFASCRQRHSFKYSLSFPASSFAAKSDLYNSRLILIMFKYSILPFVKV
jgi:hypothetical protein